MHPSVTAISAMDLLPVIRKSDPFFLFHSHFLRHHNFNTNIIPQKSDSSAVVIGFEHGKSASCLQLKKFLCACFTYLPFVFLFFGQFYSSADRTWSNWNTKFEVSYLKRTHCICTTKNGWLIPVKYSLVNLCILDLHRYRLDSSYTIFQGYTTM